MVAFSIKKKSLFTSMRQVKPLYHGSSFMVRASKVESADPFSYGLVVSKKVGNAPTRNHTKRRLRMLIMEMILKPGLKLQKNCFVIYTRPSITRETYANLKHEMAQMCASLSKG